MKIDGINLGGQQDADQFNSIIISVNKHGIIRLTDIETGERIVDNLPIDSQIIPHANSVCFGNEKYEEKDDFPVVYVNAYNNRELPLGVCYVIRIMQNAGEYSATIVQTLKIGFTDDSQKWPSASQSRPFGNFVVDKEKSLIFAYVPDYKIGKLRFYAFELPSLSSGDEVLFSFDDVRLYFETELVNWPQGCIARNGKLFLLFGWQDIKYLIIIDANNTMIEHSFDFYENGFDFTLEPEAIWIYKDYLYFTLSGYVYRGVLVVQSEE